MTSIQLTAVKKPLKTVDRDPHDPGQGEVTVALKAAALNRRDYWITQGLYPGIETPCTLGSDGAGVVSAAGDGADASWVGREVVINPGLDWGDDPTAQSDAFRILGMPDHGTFATHVNVPAVQLAEKPPHLDWPQAAALPLAGVTGALPAW